MPQKRREQVIAGFGGDHVPDGYRGVPRGRRMFLEAVERVAPAAMESLRAIAHDLPDEYHLTQASRQREAPLRTWCRQWGFIGSDRTMGPDWLLTVARRTASAMRDGIWKPGRLSAFAYSYREPAVPEPVPELTGWNPIEETEQRFRARVDTYVSKVKASMNAAGVRTAPRVRGQEEDINRHFDWLALYQVKHLTYSEIVESVGETLPDIDESTVRKAVHRAAALAGVTLLANRRGRPPKNRKQRGHS